MAVQLGRRGSIATAVFFCTELLFLKYGTKNLHIIKKLFIRKVMKVSRKSVYIILLIVCILLCGIQINRKETQIKETMGTGNVINSENDGTKKIAITFDDGPHPQYTEQLLDGLKERGVKATFFVTGEHAELHPDLIKRMQEEGHLIGNHTYSHIQLASNNREEFRNQIIKTNEIIEGITGVEVQYVRPPYGTWDKKLEAELNMFPVLWTVDPQDWSSSNATSVAEKVVSKAGENDIILMHDYFESSVTAALKAVDELKEEGFTFVTVEEIMFD